MNLLMLPERTLFICDTYVNVDPSPSRSPRSTLLAAERSAASASRPGWRCCRTRASAAATRRRRAKMRRALELFREHGRSLRSRARCTATRRCRRRCCDRCSRTRASSGEANLLVMPDAGRGQHPFNLLKVTAASGITVGPILLGRGQAGAHPDAPRHRAAHRQHDGAGGGGRRRDPAHRAIGGRLKPRATSSRRFRSAAWATPRKSQPDLRHSFAQATCLFLVLVCPAGRGYPRGYRLDLGHRRQSIQRHEGRAWIDPNSTRRSYPLPSVDSNRK